MDDFFENFEVANEVNSNSNVLKMVLQKYKTYAILQI